MKKEMLINCLQAEEIRIAILENGVLEELYVERASHESYVGNIYKGRIVNIEPSIQAAFVDFGVGRNGFLHVSDVEPAYYRELEQQQNSRRGDRGDRGGRGRSPRHHDDYDAPPRREQRPQRDPPAAESQASEAPPTPIHHDSTWDEIRGDGPDVIVEQIMEEEDFTPGYEADAAGPEQEPDWPATPENPETAFDEPRHETGAPNAAWQPAPDAYADEDPAEETAAGDAVPQGEKTDPDAEKPDAEEGKSRRRGSRGGKGKAQRGRKPRKRTGKDDAGETPHEPPADEGPRPESDEPRPRPMDSSEHRTGDDDPPPGPLEPRPARDLSDDDLSFSSAPPPSAAPKPLAEPQEEIIVEEEEFVEADAFGDSEELTSDPMEPAIPKVEADDTIEEIIEEEKFMEEEGEIEHAPAVSEIMDDERPGADYEDEFSDTEKFAPRPRGRDRGDRGDRRGGGGRDRGGRDRERGRGGPRGGRDGGRDRGRGGPRGRDGGRPGLGRPKPHIEDIFKRGQEVLVQVIKEGIGTKGPTLSTYISIAGRYLVWMPGLNRIGVSRKIEDEEVRRRLREIMNELRPPKGIGFIIRTAGQDRNREELQSDLAYLSRLWQVVVRRIKKQKSPCEIYRESDMVTRTIRDIFTSDINTIWVDERGAYDAAKEFMEAVMPRYADRIKFYDGTVPMFHKYGIENEIARIQMRHVPLPHGGSIVIDQTEAMVAIDVNSGNFRADNNNAEETAYQMNLHAAKEIARQLRLRDLGGVIANDFIDMRDERHRRGVEKALRDAVQRDRARTKILRISQFGIIEMTRQRIRPSLKRSAFHECAHCRGTGHVKTGESVSIEVMRMLQLAVNREHITRIEIRVHDEVAQYLLNRKRKEIVGLEDRGAKLVSIAGAGSAVSPEFLEFLCLDNNGNEVKFTQADEPQRPPRRRGH